MYRLVMQFHHSYMYIAFLGRYYSCLSHAFSCLCTYLSIFVDHLILGKFQVIITESIYINLTKFGIRGWVVYDRMHDTIIVL